MPQLFKLIRFLTVSAAAQLHRELAQESQAAVNFMFLTARLQGEEA